MARMVNSILIDPYRQTVTEVDHDADNYRHIYELLSGRGYPQAEADPPHPVTCFEAFYAGGNLPEGDAIFIDESGRLKGAVAFFLFDGHPLAGRGLVLGSDAMGETAAPRITFQDVCKRVQIIDGEHNIAPEPLTYQTFDTLDEMLAAMTGSRR